MFLDLTGKEVDRLPVVISGAGECQLLSVRKLQSRTGEALILTALIVVDLTEHVFF